MTRERVRIDPNPRRSTKTPPLPPLLEILQVAAVPSVVADPPALTCKDDTPVDLSDIEFAERKAAWKKPAYKFEQGVLYKYIKSVATASEGCVTDSN